jgi:chaperone modulatory protein CbpM
MSGARRLPARPPPRPTATRERAPGSSLMPARPSLMRIDDFARSAGMHPELVRRFVALGLVEASRDTDGNMWFTQAQLATVARVWRLRAGLSLNYAAIGLVIDLLERIDQLERALRSSGQGGAFAPASRTRVRPSAPPRRE